MPISVTQVSKLFILLFIKIQFHFEFTPDWHKQPQVTQLVSEYYCLLFLICKDNPKLSKCIVRCKFCQIYFITHFCTAGRNDLGCPFGCQEANRKEKSNARSSKYHRENKDKKKKLNQNRYRISSKKIEKNKINPTFRYLHIIISYIEQRIISFQEILSLIIKSIKFLKI